MRDKSPTLSLKPASSIDSDLFVVTGVECRAKDVVRGTTDNRVPGREFDVCSFSTRIYRRQEVLQLIVRTTRYIVRSVAFCRSIEMNC